MKALFCIICSYIWKTPAPDQCPQCGSKCLDCVTIDDNEGHYEGDFPRKQHTDEIEE